MTPSIVSALRGEDFSQHWYAVKLQQYYAGILLLTVIRALTGQYWQKDINHRERRVFRFHARRLPIDMWFINIGFSTDTNAWCRALNMQFSLRSLMRLRVAFQYVARG